jgi:hypothetical protein
MTVLPTPTVPEDSGDPPPFTRRPTLPVEEDVVEATDEPAPVATATFPAFPVESDALAYTGDPGVLFVVAVALVAVGTALVRAARRLS